MMTILILSGFDGWENKRYRPDLTSSWPCLASELAIPIHGAGGAAELNRKIRQGELFCERKKEPLKKPGDFVWRATLVDSLANTNKIQIIPPLFL